MQMQAPMSDVLWAFLALKWDRIKVPIKDIKTAHKSDRLSNKMEQKHFASDLHEYIQGVKKSSDCL